MAILFWLLQNTGRWWRNYTSLLPSFSDGKFLANYVLSCLRRRREIIGLLSFMLYSFSFLFLLPFTAMVASALENAIHGTLSQDYIGTTT